MERTYETRCGKCGSVAELCTCKGGGKFSVEGSEFNDVQDDEYEAVKDFNNDVTE